MLLPSTKEQQEIVDQVKFNEKLKKAFQDGLTVKQTSKYDGHGSNEVTVKLLLFGEVIAEIYL